MVNRCFPLVRADLPTEAVNLDIQKRVPGLPSITRQAVIEAVRASYARLSNDAGWRSLGSAESHKLVPSCEEPGVTSPQRRVTEKKRSKGATTTTGPNSTAEFPVDVLLEELTDPDFTFLEAPGIQRELSLEELRRKYRVKTRAESNQPAATTSQRVVGAGQPVFRPGQVSQQKLVESIMPRGTALPAEQMRTDEFAPGVNSNLPMEGGGGPDRTRNQPYQPAGWRSATSRRRGRREASEFRRQRDRFSRPEYDRRRGGGDRPNQQLYRSRSRSSSPSRRSRPGNVRSSDLGDLLRDLGAAVRDGIHRR